MMKKLLCLLLCLCFALPLAAAEGLTTEVFDVSDLYIIPDSDTRELTEQELWGYTQETLGYIRNEILARHGYAFHNMKFYEYFNAKPWYAAGGYKGMDSLTNVERRNHTLVRQVENAMAAQNNANAQGADIAEIIETQNALGTGGFGNQRDLGNAYGNGDGKTYAEEEAERKAREKLEKMQQSAQPNYIYNTQSIIPDSSTRALTEPELWAYSREALRYIRNEILARHGYIFGDNKFGRYFKTKDWYSEGGYSDALVSSQEWANINTIRRVEGYMDQLGTQNEQGLDITTIIANQKNGNCPK